MSTISENPISALQYQDSVLSRFRLTISQTEVEYWEYSHPFLISKHGPRHAARGANTGAQRRMYNLDQTRNKVRRLVNANVGAYGYEACFLTFTYAMNMGDIGTAWSDWAAFMRRMRRRFGKLHALSVMEFQKRGAVHFHCIFFNLPPEVEERERSSREIASLWGHGFVDIERIRSARNVGAYVCKYMNKSADDERLRGKKFFSTTQNLFSPVTHRGEVAKSKMMSILAKGNHELQAETQYEYCDAPVTYRSYKQTNFLCSPSKMCGSCRAKKSLTSSTEKKESGTLP